MSNSNITYSKKDAAINARIYGTFLEYNFEDGWPKVDKLDNFKLLCKIADFTHSSFIGSSCLDVGCGTGDFSAILRQKGISKYIGIDIFPSAVSIARNKYPFDNFFVNDFLAHNFNEKFDFVFCSGALTTPLDSDNYAILEAFVGKMWRVAKQGIAFNFLFRNHPSQHDDMLFLYDEKQVLEICKKSIPDAQIETIVTSAGKYSELAEMHVFIFQ